MRSIERFKDDRDFLSADMGVKVFEDTFYDHEGWLQQSMVKITIDSTVLS